MPNDKAHRGGSDAASILGLNLALQKKNKSRDLDDLANVDLDKNVSYSIPAKGVSPIGLKESESENRVIKSQTVGFVKNTAKLRLPDGSLVNYESRIISGEDLAKVTIYQGNPRAKTNPDISGLRKKIAMTGGNIIAVKARLLADGTVEVIAGSRRTKAVKEEHLSLLADVITDEVSELNARQLAYIENDGREDPDVFEESEFFSTTFATYKAEGVVGTVEEFGRLFDMSKVNMWRYLNIATIPNWLFSLCPRFVTDLQGSVKSTWSLRKAEELYSLVKEYGDMLDGEVRSLLTHHQFSKPDEVITGIKKTLKTPVTPKPKNQLSIDGKDIGYFEYGKRKKTLKLHLTEDAPSELIEQIEKLMAQYSN